MVCPHVRLARKKGQGWSGWTSKAYMLVPRLTHRHSNVFVPAIALGLRRRAPLRMAGSAPKFRRSLTAAVWPAAAAAIRGVVSQHNPLRLARAWSKARDVRVGGGT